MCVEQLLAGASASNKSIFRSVRSSGDSEVDQIVFEKTLEERDSGWLRGPMEFHELPEGAILSRRFGLKQPNKVRLIDDLSASSINKTVQCNETPRPHTTDVIASVALGLLERCYGEVLGKTFDLKSAYRQLSFVFLHCMLRSSEEMSCYLPNASSALWCSPSCLFISSYCTLSLVDWLQVFEVVLDQLLRRLCDFYRCSAG